MQLFGSLRKEMKKPHTPKIREILRTHAEGLTSKQIHVQMPEVKKSETIKSSLRKMPDVYIDRWVLEKGNRGQYQAVYMAVIPPQDCPHPKERYAVICKTRWVDRGAQT